MKRELERKERAVQKQMISSTTKPKSAFTLFLENAKNHDNIIIRYLARFFYTTWIIVLAIGGFLALVFGYIAA
ncbi:hypothetical protein [Nonlabens marinus]|uniref:hypothetical protein n=1 Tax=Nonlabens marinus TaxID=930802 RepID=UPI0011DD2FFB|nr:hypothetical protein [Nonlabens marinus]